MKNKALIAFLSVFLNYGKVFFLMLAVFKKNGHGLEILPS
jgi:hypothetical protein